MAAHQVLPSLGFSRQEHWSGLPFPPPMRESEVAQSCPTLSDPSRLLRPWDFPGKSTGVGCHCLLLKPLKGPLNPQPPILTRQMSLLPTAPEKKFPEMRPYTLALPPLKQEAMTLKPQKRFPTPSIGQDPKQTRVSSQRGSGTRGPYMGSCTFLNF